MTLMMNCENAKISKIFFDRADQKLLDILDEVRTNPEARKSLQELFGSSFHPNGIKEMAADRASRIVLAMFNLLDNVEPGELIMNQRLSALRTLRYEVIDNGGSPLRLNAARVALQCMKDFLRVDPENRGTRLKLAHDLRMALLGQPSFIRQQLKKYHLLEMPESWNQLTFDHHVHDGNTKGRKSPTHLIMDAWIKGIRNLKVIYYNFVPFQAAQELLEAADVMGIQIRIGIEYTAIFRNRWIELICAPRGFNGNADYLAYLKSPRMAEHQVQALEVIEYQTKLVLHVLDDFNGNHLASLNSDFNLDLAPITHEEFLTAVSYGQPAVSHLAELIYQHIRSACEDKFKTMDVKSPEYLAICQKMNALSAEEIREKYINSSIMDLVPPLNELPQLKRCTPEELINHLDRIAPAYRLTLNLSKLSLEDVIEILFDCHGRITHLEMFNLKDTVLGLRDNDQVINELRLALNNGAVIKIKQIINIAIERIQRSEAPNRAERLEKFHQMLLALPTFTEMYSAKPLQAHVGSDSASRSKRVHGMGFAVVESLPRRVQKMLHSERNKNVELLPVSADIHKTYNELPRNTILHNIFLPWWKNMLSRSISRNESEWVCDDPVAHIGKKKGNLVTLGGYFQAQVNFSPIRLTGKLFHSPREYWQYLDSNWKLALKILCGFLPAFISFFYTSEWPLLMYGGAFIWLGITGVRNVIQAVLGGGGFRRSQLLKWNVFVSWQRVADSLLFTGISVPLLDYVVKTLILKNLFKLEAETNPFWVFTGLAVANSIYICGHNVWRGFSRTAIIGNAFRPIFAVPVAIAMNSMLSVSLIGFSAEEIARILQQWAAIISKLSSDIVAGVIEGYSDRKDNIIKRVLDYRLKMRIIFQLCYKLELLFPERSSIELLNDGKYLFNALTERGNTEIWRELVINDLDLLYFWYYQPQAPTTFKLMVRYLTRDERELLNASQNILMSDRTISEMFINNLLSENFTRPLAFYLDYHNSYIRQLGGIMKKTKYLTTESEN